MSELGARDHRRLHRDGHTLTQPLVLVGVLTEAFMFLSDLARHTSTCRWRSNFMAVSSYGSATTTSGVVRIVKDLDLDLTGRHVLIVEDIIDSGLTLRYLRKNLHHRGRGVGQRVRAARARRPPARSTPTWRYEGFHIPPDFVIRLRARRRRAVLRNLADIHAYLPRRRPDAGPAGRPPSMGAAAGMARR